MVMMPLVLAPLAAQKIEDETASRERVVRVQTALKHLTVIEVAEPVTTVAVGSPEAFKIERRENKVFIEPLEENVATNLFIWTASTRLNYELVPAISDAGEMDFAIDYRPPQPQAKIAGPKSSEPQAKASDLPIPSEMLLNGIPVRLAGASSARTDFGLVLRDVYRTQDEVYVRYSVENRSSKTLRTGVPTVVSLSNPELDPSLWSLHNSQLGTKYASRLKTSGPPLPIQIRCTERDFAEIAPGDEQVGLVALHMPGGSNYGSGRPTVLEFRFPLDRGGRLTATLVL
jgi:Conjugal transfer protein